MTTEIDYWALGRAILADERFREIRPHLGGVRPDVQGAILAQLVALWLAGHVSTDPGLQDKVREDMLEQLVATARQLIPVMYELHVRRLR
jgi:hypothetical protein